MDKINVIVVDDESSTTEKLERYLAEINDFNLAAVCSNGEEAIKKIIEIQPQVVFLDIEMPKINGFEVINSVSEVDEIYWIFVTAHDKYAVKAFEVNALDYLLKPFNKKRFLETITRAKIFTTKDSDTKISEDSQTTREKYLSKLLIKDSNKYKLIEVKNIRYFKSSGNYIKIHIADDKHLIRSSLKELENKLDSKSFARIHKSIIVNLNFIREFEQWFTGDYEVLLTNGEKLKLSRNYKEVLQKFQ